MKKLKIILLFSALIICYRFNTIHSVYTPITTKITGTVKEIKNNTILIKAKENIIINTNKTFQYGDKVQVSGQLNYPPKTPIINGFDYQKYLLSKKVFYIMQVNKIKIVQKNKNIIYKIKNKLIQKTRNNKSFPYINSLVLGNNNDIDTPVLNSYRLNGISHLFCISGMHITLLSIILFMIFKPFFKKFLAYIVVLIILIFYVLITGLSPSSTRALIMFIVLTLSKILSKKINTKYLLLLILASSLIYNPFQIYNVGFIFTYVITYFIITFSYKITGNYFEQLFKLSLLCFFVSIPIMTYNFYYLNLLSPIINIIFVPIISFIILPLSFLSLMLPIDNILYVIINIVENLSLIISKIDILTFSLAKPNIVVVFIYFLIIIHSLKHNKYIIFVLLLIVHYNIQYFNFNNYLTMLDVNQGDSFLINLKHNRSNILIDTGGLTMNPSKSNYVKNRTIPYLQMNGIKEINYLILTHGDFDHIGEAIKLINNFSVKHIILNSGNNNNLEHIIIEIAHKKHIKCFQYNKKKLKIYNIVLKFINNKNKSDENKDSLIIYTKIDKRNILLMADASIENEKQIIKEYNLPKIDILKVGHHGSISSSSNLFINKIQPHISLISVGKHNLYGHPSPKVLTRLKSSKIYQTSKLGTVKIQLANLHIYTH